MNKVISNYSKKELKSNKLKKNLLILAIALSTVLITTIGILFTSLRESMILDTKKTYGFEHGIFIKLPEDKFNILAKHKMIKDFGRAYDIESIENSDYENQRINLIYIPKEYNEFFGLDFRNANLNNKDEVFIAKSLSENLKKNTGDYIKFKGKEFRIKGIFEAKKNQYVNTDTIVISKEYFNDLKNNLKVSNAFFTLKDESDLKHNIALVGSDLGLEEKNIMCNENLISQMEYNLEDIIPFIIIGVLVIISAIISIYNIFNISVKERIQQFGLLMALGASTKHIKSILRKEGFILCIKGIPIGLIISFIISFVVIPNLSLSIKININIKLSPGSIILSIIVVVLSVLVSLIIPSRNAGKISPLAAINYNDVEGKNKKYRKSNKVLNISKLAKVNLGRNKKRAIVTIISLSFSFILFIIVSTVLSSMSLENHVKDMVISDYQISMNIRSNVWDTENLLLDNKEVAEIKGFKGVEEIYKIKVKSIDIKGFDAGSELFAYNKELLNRCKENIISGEINEEKINNKKGILFVEDKRRVSPKLGEKIILEYIDKNTNKPKAEEFEVQAIVDHRAWKAGFAGMGPTIITSEEAFTKCFGKMGNVRIGVKVKDNRKSEFESYLNTYDTKKLEVTSYTKELDKSKNEKKAISIIAYSLVIVILIIGVVNMINTTVTNIISRRKELGIIEAIGLTDKEINKLLVNEGFYYLLVSFIICIIVGVPSSYGLYLLFKKSATYAQYNFPFVQIVIMILLMITLQVVSIKIVQFKNRKSEVVDKIRFY